ncbi:DUF1232 domain-containing protein [Brevibacillus sp. SYP-B805]|uniref:YkvA family protein n=1 Tax=Brevibacillus sp. SYP-B805 TaxID=1578199 RepID=UPI0013E9A411|nr:YkvA family protein [Brevibacillus sp. SYP-B805]NGQ93598.1 DUF1232 domain-containing protein [Brevibacillus sp. SYP-B805]
MSKQTVFQKVTSKAKKLKLEAYVLYAAYRDPRVAWYAKLFAICVVAYAFSPIDVIPDFIPILGYLDDIVLVPLGIWLALKLIPEQVIRDYRERATELLAKGKPKNWIAGVLIMVLWIVFGLWAGWYCYQNLLS